MLIKCPECFNNVSDEAHSCPFCGYPIKEKIGSTSSSKEKYSEDQIRQFAKEAKEYGASYVVCVIFGLILFLGGLFAIIFGFGPSDETTMIILVVLGSIFGDIGLLVMILGGVVNNTKAGNRIRIVKEYKERHPEFKEN